MNSIIPACLRRFLASVFILSALAQPALFAADAALPAVAKAKVSAPVTITEDANNWVLDNGIVQATIGKRNGRMTALMYHGINTMGGNAIFVDHTNSPLGERESIADVARNVERWVDVIVLRTYAHDTITEMAANARVPVINALSDFEHPCQALADFMTLEEHFGALEGLNFTYVGDGNNVCHSLMLTGAQLGVNVTVATPRGYSPDIEIVTIAREMAQANRGELRLLQDPQAAAEGADAIYTDVCVSMGYEHESTKRAPIFRPFQVNDALMQKASTRAVFMHCLPARRNDEVTDAVIDGPQSIVFDQAENRLHAQKALMLLLLGGLSNVKAFSC